MWSLATKNNPPGSIPVFWTGAYQQLYVEQGIQHLLTLLWFGHNPNNTTGKLLQLGLESLQLDLGRNGNLFAKDWTALQYLATPLWLTHTWQFQHASDLGGNNNTRDSHVPGE